MKRSDILPLIGGVVCFSLAIWGGASCYAMSIGVPGLEGSAALILLTLIVWAAWDAFVLIKHGSNATISAVIGNWLGANSLGTKAGLIAIGMALCHFLGWEKRPDDKEGEQ